MAAHPTKDGRWCEWIDLGVDPAGKRIRRRVEGQKKRDVERKAAEIRARHDRGEDVISRPRLLSELLDDWLAVVAQQGRAANTLRSYRGACRNQLAPRLGGTSVSRLQARQIQRVFDEFARQLAPTHVRQLKSILVQALDLAVEQREIALNPAAKVRIPTVGRTPGRSLTPDEVQALTAAAAGHRYGLAIHLALLGLRRGEIPALHWEDFDPVAGTLAIKRQLQRIEGRWVEITPKAGSTGVLTLGPGLIAGLELLKRTQAVERRAMGWAESPYIFVSVRTGGVCPASTIYRAFRQIAQAAGINAARLHDCRHTAATTLLASGRDIGTVAGVLRHASPQTTATIYAHALPDRVAEASSELEGIYQKRRQG